MTTLTTLATADRGEDDAFSRLAALARSLAHNGYVRELADQIEAEYRRCSDRGDAAMAQLGRDWATVGQAACTIRAAAERNGG